ncbi:MAG TPA: hypothetical protein DDY78_13675 [Planctomycetales bacterium]|nr:hypothetical protein [Planctomycetales bacterium]
MSTVPPNPSQYPPGTRPAAAGEPVFVTPPVAPQQVIIQQPVEAPAVKPHHTHLEQPQEVNVISHSNFFYWWPVWLVGYIMAAVTYGWGNHVEISPGNVEMIYAGKNPGVIFTLTFFLVILITNVTVRGLSSLVILLVIAFGILLAAYMQWWDTLLKEFSLLSIHMNLGFYVTFSTLLFVVWAISTFIYDHLSYWRVTPGQVTHEFLIGAASKSYDTRGMVFEKHRNDLFRHWVLGFGSGDINISTTGAQKTSIAIPNVLFVDAKVLAIQRLIAMKPDQFEGPPA